MSVERFYFLFEWETEHRVLLFKIFPFVLFFFACVLNCLKLFFVYLLFSLSFYWILYNIVFFMLHSIFTLYFLFLSTMNLNARVIFFYFPFLSMIGKFDSRLIGFMNILCQSLEKWHVLLETTAYYFWLLLNIFRGVWAKKDIFCSHPSICCRYLKLKFESVSGQCK